MSKQTLIRITTVPLSLEKLLSGQLHFMSSIYNVIAVSSDKERLERFGKFEKVAVFPLGMTRKITPLRDVFAVLKLYFFLKKTKPFIVHTHTPKAGIVGMIASKLAGVPHRLHTVAGLPLLEGTGFKRILLDFVEKVTYSCATNVYPNSQGLSKIIIENKYCSPEKLKVLAEGSSNGIDTNYFNPELFSIVENLSLKKELGITEEDFVFVFVGRLVKDKGINEMIEAFEFLQKENRAVKLLLVGDYESKLDPLSTHSMDSIKSNKSIVSVGFQKDVRPYYAISDVLVFPSYREGFPNVVLQAGAMGLPSIVTNINGCNEIICEGENGIIIPVKNRDAIYEAMKKVITNATLRGKLQRQARKMIVSRYEQKVVWEAILAEYKRIENDV